MGLGGLSLSFLALLSSPLVPGVSAANKPKNAILLSEVQSLTLKAGKQTSHRRVTPIPQLKCISPQRICALHQIDTLRCVNQGSSYGKEDIEWACTATDLPTTLRLGSTEVICEGYSSPEDSYVLKGSCGVEYRLVLTEEGEKRFPELAKGSSSGWKFGGGDGGGEDTDWSGYLFALLFFAVLGWIIYSACVQAGDNNGRRVGQAGGRRPGGGGGGGGGGWGPGFGGGGNGGWDDPPPPYSKSTYNTRAGGGAADQAWRPGFWTGAATGAAAGYFAGNRGNNNTTGSSWRQQPRRDNGEGSSSFWGGGGGGSSFSGTSSGRHESTGFGSTSRR
ncbi:transmembrane protein [Rhypophila sp. PSN 637]